MVCHGHHDWMIAAGLPWLLKGDILCSMKKIRSEPNSSIVMWKRQHKPSPVGGDWALEMEWCNVKWPHMSWLVTGMDKTIEFTKLGIYVVQSGVSQILFDILGLGTIRPKWRLDLRWCSDVFLSMPLMFAVPSFHLKEKLVSSAQRVSLIIGMCTTTCGIAGKPPVRQNWTKGSSFFISVNGW